MAAHTMGIINDECRYLQSIAEPRPTPRHRTCDLWWPMWIVTAVDSSAVIARNTGNWWLHFLFVGLHQLVREN